uniref:Innexin n=1 Tax=Trichuris muris TaxID=70415 RepID=A0A5S6QDG0_TRIMR
MDRVTQFLSTVKPYRDGDFVDRLNSFYTVISLVACTLIVSGWSFVGSPIQCWFPAYFKGWWIQYSLDYCYVQNTYFLPFYNKTPIKNYWDLISSPIDIPMQIEEREAHLIGYYQWVPFILALVAICFYVPTAIWRTLNKHSGISVKTICDMTSIVHHVEPSSRRKNVDKMVRLLDHSVVLAENLYGNVFMTGHYISGLYLVVKGLFLVNSVAQFFLLQAFLGAKDNLWGLRVAQNLLEGTQWEETGHFPRVTVCDFEVRELGNLHRHSVQCVLMINMFNEKIFLFLWWWFLILIVANSLSLLSWLVVLLVDTLNVRLIRDYLKTLDYPALKRKEFEYNLRDFMRKFLRPDGIFLLRLISCNSGDVVSREMVDCMWRRYQSRYLKASPDDDHNSLLPGSPYATADGDSTLPIEPSFTQAGNGRNPPNSSQVNAQESTL